MTDPGRFTDAKLFCPVSGLNATGEENLTIESQIHRLHRLLCVICVICGYYTETNITGDSV